MPLYSKKDFAKNCGKSPAHVSMAITRGKIILSGDYIDTKIPENLELMNKWRVAEGMEPMVVEVPKKIEPAPNVADPIRPTTDSPNVSAPTPAKSELAALNKEKTRAEIDYKTEKARETRLKNAKLRGELIPTNMVIDLFAMLGHQFQTQYEIGASEMIMELAHKLKISSEIEGEIGEKLTELINNAHQKAVDDAKIGIKNIISAVSGAEMDSGDGDDDDDQ
jgi:hypothetical protein